MKKVLIIVGLVLGFVLCAVTTFFVTNYFHNKETEQLTSQIATLNSNLEAIGPVVPCYTVQSSTFPGQELTEDNITEQSIPQNLKNDTFRYQGRYHRSVQQDCHHSWYSYHKGHGDGN